MIFYLDILVVPRNRLKDFFGFLRAFWAAVRFFRGFFGAPLVRIASVSFSFLSFFFIFFQNIC